MDNIAPYFLSILSKAIELFVVLSVVIISAWYLRYYHFYKHMKHIPSIPYVLPLFGTALQFPTTVAIHDNIKKYRHKLGEVFWSMMGVKPSIFVTDPTLIGMILNTNIDKPWMYAYFHRWLGSQSLFTSRGQRWKSLRKIFTPAFHFKILEAYVENFDSTSDVLVRKLNDEVGKESTDIYPFMSRATLDSVCEAAMGTKINAQDIEKSPYVKSINDLTGIIMGRTTSVTEHFEFTYRFTKTYRKEIEGVKIIHDFVNAIIVKRKQEALSSANNSSNRENDFGEKRKLAFLDLLLQFNNNNSGVFLTDEDIRQGVDSFLFGGYDTQASTLSFAIYLLANNPDVQQKAFEELQCIFGDDKNRKLTFKDVQDMKYLDLVLKETLRMYPAVPLYGRFLYEDMEYDGKILPKGLTICIAVYLMHMDEKYFPNPEKFEPERFSQENSKDRHPYSYVPFSAGPRICIGQKFGMIAMKATLSKILRNFELLPVKHDMVLALETVLKSKNGIMVQIKKRRRKNSSVIIFAYGIQRDPRTFINPDKFDPDRFLLENAQERNTYSYIPFSAGPRNCIETLPTFLKYRQLYKGNFKIYLGLESMLVISEPKALEYLLNSTTIINKSSGYKFLHNWLGTGLVTAGGKKWKERTRIIAPAFHNQLFEKYVEHFNSSLDCLIQVLSHEITNESTDAGPFITNCTLDIICESMMGTSVNAQKYPNSEYVKSVKELPRIVVERTFSITQKYDWLYYFSKNYKKEKKALEIIHDFTDSVMRKRKLEMFSKDKECVESFDNFGKKKLSFLDLLLMRKFEENIFSDKELRDEVDVMLFAGHDTTATSTAFVLHCLSSHPKIQQRVYEEINEIFSDYLHKPISYKDLHEMDYLERVIKESMRLYSTALMFGRQVTEDVLFDSILLPKGLTITVLTTGVHKDHETYPDPDTFDPDRFLPQNTRKRNSFTYLPFSAGPRNCIGQKFAMLEMKAIIATVARNFELRPTVPEHKIELVVNTNLKPKNGVVMQLRKRI